MKNIIIKYGLLGCVLTVFVPIIAWAIMKFNGVEEVDYSSGEIIGYSSIIISMIFVFLGMKKFRDDENNGNLSFLEAMKVGLLIVAIPSLGFGLYNFVYTEYMEPDFMDDYYEYSIDQMKGELSPAEFEAHVAEMESQKEMFMNPLVGFAVMFFTVFIIGIIATLISSLILRKDSKVPAENLSVT